MQRYPILLITLLLVVCTSCNRSKDTTTDNHYKFRKYISYTDTGRTSIASPIHVNLAKALSQYEIDQELPATIFSISPKVKGTLSIKNQRNLIFTPDEQLDPDTEYSVSVQLHKLYDDIPKALNTFTFAFKTITPNFKVDIDQLQSYDKQWQYLEGQIETADVISFKKAQELINATQAGKAINIKWYTQEKASN